MNAFIILALCALASGSASASTLKTQTLMADGFKGQQLAQATLQAPLQTTFQAALPTSQVLYSAAPAVNYIRSAPLFHRALSYEMPIRTHAIYRSAPLAVAYEAPIVEARPLAAAWQSPVIEAPIKTVAQEIDAVKGYRYAEPIKSQLEVVKGAPLQQEIRVQEPMRAQLTTQLHESFKGQSYAEAVKTMPAAQVVSQEIKSFQAAKL